MNEHKEILMDLLKEGQTLFDRLTLANESNAESRYNELENIVGTDIWLKKGNAELFKAHAYLYYLDYLKENNIFVNPNSEVDYNFIYNLVKEEISKEIKKEDDEFYLSEAKAIEERNKKTVEELQNLIKGSKNVNDNYERCLDRIEKAKKDLEDEEARGTNADPETIASYKRIIATNEERLKEFEEGRNNLDTKFMSLKVELNNNFEEDIKKQIASIEEAYLNGTRIDDPVFATNGKPILEGDLEEYEALCQLLKVRANIDLTKDIVLVDGVVCANNETQAEYIRGLMAKTKLFSKLSPKMQASKYNELSPEGINQKLIDDIVKKLRALEGKAKNIRDGYKIVFDNVPKKVMRRVPGKKIEEEVEIIDRISIAKVLEDDYDEYVTLFNMLKMLNKVNNSYVWQMTNVWDVAYVDVTDENQFKRLLSASKAYNHLDPSHAQAAKNNKVIKDIRSFLESAVAKSNEAKEKDRKLGRNTPLREIKSKTDRFEVLEDDYPECKYLVDILDILENTEFKDLDDVLGICYANKSVSNKLSSLIKSVKFFNYPKEKTLAEQIESKKNELIKLVEKIDGIDKSNLASNGLCLESDESRFDTLLEQCIHLTINSLNNGLEESANYRQVRAEILKELEQVATPKKSINEAAIAEVNTKLEKFNKDHPDMSKLSPEEYQYYTLLIEQMRLLRDAEAATDLEVVEGAEVSANAKADYEKIIAEIKKLETKGRNNPDDKEKKLNEETAKMVEELNKCLDSFPDDLTDEETMLYNLYEEIRDILEASLQSNDYEVINNLKVDRQKVPRYNELFQKIGELTKPKPKTIVPENEARIKEIENELADLVKKGAQVFYKEKVAKTKDNKEVDQDDLPRYELLKDELDMLKDANPSDTLDSVDGVKVKDAASYKKIKEQLASLEPTKKGEKKKAKPKKEKERKGKREKVKKVRKLKDPNKGWIKRHWKALTAGGLGLGLAASVAKSFATLNPVLTSSVIPTLASFGSFVLPAGVVVGLRKAIGKEIESNSALGLGDPLTRASNTLNAQILYEATELNPAAELLDSEHDVLKLDNTELALDSDDSTDLLLKAQKNIEERYSRLNNNISNNAKPIVVNVPPLADTLDNLNIEQLKEKLDNLQKLFDENKIPPESRAEAEKELGDIIKKLDELSSKNVGAPFANDFEPPKIGEPPASDLGDSFAEPENLFADQRSTPAPIAPSPVVTPSEPSENQAILNELYELYRINNELEAKINEGYQSPEAIDAMTATIQDNIAKMASIKDAEDALIERRMKIIDISEEAKKRVQNGEITNEEADRIENSVFEEYRNIMDIVTLIQENSKPLKY